MCPTGECDGVCLPEAHGIGDPPDDQCGDLYGVFCIEDDTWCPALEREPFTGTRAQADAEVVHWRSGRRTGLGDRLRPGVASQRFHYEVRAYDKKMGR